MKKIKLNMKKGFTLIESLIAIAILLIAVVAPMSTIGGSLSSIYVARDQMIAVNFAQEGVEVVRQKRDSNMLNKWKNGVGNWYDGLPAGDYLIDPANISGSGPLQMCVSCTSNDKLIRQDPTSNLFYQTINATTGNITQFTRVVNITDVPATPLAEKIVTSTVTWSVGGVIKKAEAKESIFGINS